MSYPNSPFSGDPTNPYASPQVEMILPPGVRWAQADSPSLRQTGVGLTLVYYGIVTVLLSIVVIAVGGFVAAASRSQMALGAVFILGGLGVIVGSILNFVGPLVCLVVPAESGAKGLIVGSVIFQLANVIHSVVVLVAPRLIPETTSKVLNLLGLVAAVLFVLFMKQLSEYIGRPDLAARARNVLVAAAALFVIGVVVAVAIAATAGPAGLAGLGLLMIVLLIGALIVFVMYANLIDALRKALQYPMG